MSGSSSVGRALAFQAGCREFESRLPLQIEYGRRHKSKQERPRSSVGRALPW